MRPRPLRRLGVVEFHQGRLFDHIHLRVRNLDASRAFYRAVLDAVGVPLNDDSESHFFADHLWIRVADRAASQRFYETIAPYGGFRLANANGRSTFVGAGGSFTLVEGTPTEHLHIAFQAPDEETVQRFHEAGLTAGGTDNGRPGPRDYHPGYYSAYLLDPDGNNVEAVFHGPSTRTADSIVVRPV